MSHTTDVSVSEMSEREIKDEKRRIYSTGGEDA